MTSDAVICNVVIVELQIGVCNAPVFQEGRLGVCKRVVADLTGSNLLTPGWLVARGYWLLAGGRY